MEMQIVTLPGTVFRHALHLYTPALRFPNHFHHTIATFATYPARSVLLSTRSALGSPHVRHCVSQTRSELRSPHVRLCTPRTFVLSGRSPDRHYTRPPRRSRHGHYAHSTSTTLSARRPAHLRPVPAGE